MSLSPWELIGEPWSESEVPVKILKFFNQNECENSNLHWNQEVQIDSFDSEILAPEVEERSSIDEMPGHYIDAEAWGKVSWLLSNPRAFGDIIHVVTFFFFFF